MKANGNAGPSSSILAPSTCSISGSTVTAAGSYDGGLAPEVYPRYGDVVKLYVDTAPVSGYPQGIQIALLSSESSPAIGGKGPWRVSVPVDLTGGQPVACVVAAQPTHDFEGAPARY
jgi:hypothetical protein